MMTTRPPLADRHSGMVWEDATCPLCGRDRASLMIEAPDQLPTKGTGLWFAVVRCEHCGTAYTHPRPSADAIGQFYPPEYHPHRRPAKMQQSRPTRPIWARLFGRPCNERRGLLPWPRPGRLLDFGCGGGSFLKTMADQGWKVIGLDAAVGAVRQIQEELGLEALVGSLPHPELHPCSFDIITMWHSLEHVHKPLEILREAYQLLAPGGKIIVATPNIESLPFYWFGQSWFGLDLPRHLTHFTPKSMKAMLQAAGFEVERFRLLRHNDWLRSSAKQAVASGRGGVWARLMKWKPAAKVVSWGGYAMGLSDCMMAVAQRPPS